jgi:hypothetical protein
MRKDILLAGFIVIAPHGDYKAIEECATTPYFKASEATFTTDDDLMFRNINMCRLVLNAHHEGWIATGTNKPDPFPPASFHQDNDFKYKKDEWMKLHPKSILNSQ